MLVFDLSLVFFLLGSRLYLGSIIALEVAASKCAHICIYTGLLRPHYRIYIDSRRLSTTSSLEHLELQILYLLLMLLAYFFYTRVDKVIALRLFLGNLVCRQTSTNIEILAEANLGHSIDSLDAECQTLLILVANRAA